MGSKKDTKRINQPTRSASGSTGHFDVLSDVLESLRFRGSIFFRSELAAPWGIALKQMAVPRFHISIQGRCVVGSTLDPVTQLDEMDIVMIPRGAQHWISDQPGRPLISDDEAAEACQLGQPHFQQGEISNRLMCGMVRYDTRLRHALFDSLPETIHFSQISHDDPIWQTVMLIDSEMARRHQPSAITDRLTEVLFMQLLNRYMQSGEGQFGFMTALADQRVHHALQLLHREPARDWSLSALGDCVGMSSSTLVRQFRKTLDVTPMNYLAQWRMIRAWSLVGDLRLGMEQVAQELGFTSARSFARAFQRHYGQSPSEVRRHRQHGMTVLDDA